MKKNKKDNELNKLVDFANFTPEQIRTLQLKLKGILEALDLFCKENNLRYYLAGGTCIGAVRHKGFIPWDDDLDVAMPREDFEQMFKLWNNEKSRFKIQRPTKDVLTGVQIGLIRDSETTCIYEYARDYDICHGIKIDVEPIDGCPKNIIAEKIQKFFCLVYSLMAAQRIPNQASNSIKTLARIILSIIRSKKIRYWLFSFAEKQIKKYKIENCSRVRVGYNLVYEKEVFQGSKLLDFEGKKYPVPNNYDVYLRKEYGDYMQYPPEQKRKPITKAYFYDPETPCIKYKGIKYCIEKV